MMTQERQLPDLPEIGHPESYYAKRAHEAERTGNYHSKEAHKVGQYVTLAMDPALTWEQKLKYFNHALKRHCNPPPVPDEATWLFYRELAELIRAHAGQEGLRLAMMEDDLYDKRVKLGVPRERIEEEAELFFTRLLGNQNHCPDHFDEEEWRQLKMIRYKWI